MPRKSRLSEEQIRNILQATSYSDSEGEDIGIERDDEYIPPPCSSSDESSSMEEVQATENFTVHEDVSVSEGKSVTEWVYLLLNMCICY